MRGVLGVLRSDPLVDPPFTLVLLSDVTSRGVTSLALSEPLTEEAEDRGDIGNLEVIKFPFSALLLPMLGPGLKRIFEKPFSRNNPQFPE